MNQPLPLKEQLRTLEQLQELDLRIDSIKKKKAALPAALKALDDSFNKIRLSLDAKKNQQVENEKIQRQTQAAIDLNNDRLARANGKLEGVHNSQEFQAANKEIDQLRKMNTSLQEQLKKSNEAIEGTQKEVATLTVDFDKLNGEREKQMAVMSDESGKLDGDIGALMKERGKFTGSIEPRMLAQYDRIRAARAGIGLVPAIGGRCSGCNMMVPPQMYNEIQRGNTLHSCPSCNRLLFVPDSGQKAAAAAPEVNK